MTDQRNSSAMTLTWRDTEDLSLVSVVRLLRLFCSLCPVAIAGALFCLSFESCRRASSPSGGLSKLKPCRLRGIDEGLLCGNLTVFENRKTRAGRSIDLNVLVLPAFDQKTKSEPLFEFAGGPGVAATLSLARSAAPAGSLGPAARVPFSGPRAGLG